MGQRKPRQRKLRAIGHQAGQGEWVNVQTETKAKVDEVIGAKGQPVTVLRFTGDISSSSRDTVLGTYEGVTKSRPVLIDFSKVEYINSSGIAFVIQILMKASKADQTIAAFGLAPHFQKVFTMVGITKYAALHRDEASAVASLSKESDGAGAFASN